MIERYQSLVRSAGKYPIFSRIQYHAGTYICIPAAYAPHARSAKWEKGWFFFFLFLFQASADAEQRHVPTKRRYLPMYAVCGKLAVSKDEGQTTAAVIGSPVIIADNAAPPHF